jgi:hypothetical protein
MRTREVNGTVYVRDQGTWRPLSASEQTAYETSPLQAFGLGVAQNATGTFDTLTRSAMAQAGMGYPQQPVMPEAINAQQYAQQVGQFQPGAVLAGNLAPDIALSNPAGMAKGLWGLGKGIKGAMASRVASAIASEGASRGVTLGERTGWGWAQKLDSAVGSQGGYAGLSARREAGLVKAAAQAIGEPATKKIGPAVLDSAARRIGGGMDDLLSGGFTLKPETVATLQSVPNPGGKLGGMLARIPETGEVPGELVKNLRRTLTDRAMAARGGDGLLADDLTNAVESLLDDVTAQLPAGGKEQWSLLRQQYKTLMTLESIPEIRHSGTLTARQAANALHRSYGSTYTRMRGTADPATNAFMEQARGLAELKPFPDSGTASRLGPVVGIAAGAASGNDVGESAQNAAIYGAAGYLVPTAVGRALIAAGRLVP